MRPVVVSALAVLLFLGGFVAVDAGSDDLRAELERIHAVASRLSLEPEPDPRERPERLAPLQLVSVAGLEGPPPWPEHPRIGEESAMVNEAYLGPSAAEKENDPLHGFAGDLVDFVRDQQMADGQADLRIQPIASSLVFRGSDADRERIERLLDSALRPRMHRSILVETRWTSGFEGRHVALANARSLFWVGRQRAMHADPTVEGTGAPHGTSDPYIEMMHLGELLMVLNRPSPRGIELDCYFESRRASGPMRRVATKHSGTLDQPSYRETLVRPRVKARRGEWITIHRGAGELSVRARVLERGDR